MAAASPPPSTSLPGSTQNNNAIHSLRAFSIISIILHSIWPNLFLHGYLGADIFFVTSGYLITRSVLNPKYLNFSIFHFYLSYAKRIFPICLFTITVTIICGYYFLLKSHFLMLIWEAIWSMLFINNYSGLFTPDKFSFKSDFKFLAHTWLLGIEIQFCLIAPFLLRFINARQKPVKWIFAGIVLSVLLQLLIGFELLFCRIWQFLIGSLVYYYWCSSPCEYHLIEKEKNKIQWKKIIYYILWISLLIACLCKFPNTDKSLIIVAILRIFVTVITGLLIGYGNNPEIDIWIPYFTNTVIFYISNIFYCLYLIHWPIILFFKYFGILQGYWTLIVIFIILFLSIIIYETSKKIVASFSWKINGTIMLTFYAIIITIKIFSHPYPNPNISVPIDAKSPLYNPILANEMEAFSCDDPHYPCDEGIFDFISRNGKYKPYCTYNLNPESSNKTAVIFGNSFAYTQSKGILTAIKSSKIKFKKVYLVIAFSCNSIVGDLDTGFKCQEANSINSKFLESLKPDLIIFSALMAQIKELQKPVPSTEEIIKHPIYPHLRTLLRYANYTKKFIIIEPTPAGTMGRAYKTPLSISEALIAGNDLSLYKKNITAYKKVDYNVWKWFQPVIEECKNCRTVTTRDIFCNETIGCDFIDRKTNLGLFCDEGHISPRTSFKLIPKLIFAIEN